MEGAAKLLHVPGDVPWLVVLQSESAGVDRETRVDVNTLQGCDIDLASPVIR